MVGRLVLAVALVGPSCATIPDTVVSLPAEEHDGWKRQECWCPTRFDEHACCWYQGIKGSLLLVCTLNGGDVWNIVHRTDVVEVDPTQPRLEDTY